MAAAEIASEGQEKPVDGRLNRVSHAYGSKLDGSAIRTTCTHCRAFL